MSPRLIALVPSTSASANGNGWHHGPPPLPHVHAWRQVGMLVLRDPDEPRLHACIHLVLHLRPEDRLYEIGVYREGWDYATVFQAQAHPEETHDQAERREGGLRLLNELLAAAYGVPA